MISKEEAKKKIAELVERFTEQYDSYSCWCENRINQIVYQLYGLTEEEIKIVEGE